MEPEQVHETIKKYTIGDGLPIVLDIPNCKGSWVCDSRTGNRLLDCKSQYASQPIGWNHQIIGEWEHRLLQAAKHKVVNPDLYTDEYAKFVQEMADTCPDHKHFFFVEGGGPAIDNALKAAFDWKAQKLNRLEGEDGFMDIIHFRYAFHGRTGYAISLTNEPAPSHLTFRNDINPSPGKVKTRWYPKFPWTRVEAPATNIHGAKVYDVEQKVIDKIQETLVLGGVAALIIEPIQGEGGDNHFTPEFFHALRELTYNYEALLIFDEVQSGMGITGKTWCYEHFGVTPDILVFGKKTQVCGIAATSKIDEIPNNVFTVAGRINSTWGGNIVDMVRFQMYRQIMDIDGLVENAAIKGSYFLSKLMELPVENPRGKGLMLAFDLPSAEERSRFLEKLSKNMLVLKSGDRSVRLRPFLDITKDDVDQAIDFIKNAL